MKQPADEPQKRTMGLEERGVFEREIWWKAGLALAAELLDQVRSHAARIEKLLQPGVCQFLDFFFRVIDAALLTDAGADLPHDLLDVDVVGANMKVGHFFFFPRCAVRVARCVRVQGS